MRNALLKGAGFASEQIATEQVVEALNFDIHMETDKSGHRYIERITLWHFPCTPARKKVDNTNTSL